MFELMIPGEVLPSMHGDLLVEEVSEIRDVLASA
jgi:hypothetical protein